MKFDLKIHAILLHGHNIIPIEVKSARQYALVSLERFQAKYAQMTGTAYVVHPRNLQNEGKIVRIPPYMVPLL